MRSNSLLRHTVDYLFGYDFFVSYGHSDGKNYPAKLASELEKAGIPTFLDARVYVAGDDLNAVTRRRVRHSKYLVVVARPAAMHSQWVLREAQICLNKRRRVILIDVNETFGQSDPENSLKKLLRHHIYIEERLEDVDDNPTNDTLEKLRGSFKATRQETIRLRAVGIVAFLLIVISAAAIWMFVRSEVAREGEREQTKIAKVNEAEAKANQIETEKNLTRSHIQQGMLEINDGNYAHGVSYFCAAYHRARTAKHEPLTSSARNLISGWSIHLSTPLLHADAVAAVAFSPDGKTVLTGGMDETARLWDVTLPALDEPKRLKLSVEVRTGLFFNEQGRLQTLSQQQWLERKKRLKALGGPFDIVR